MGEAIGRDRQTAKVLLTILVFALALAIVYVARTVFVVFVFSILFAYLIDPVVRFLQRHSLFFKNLRGPHILEAYLAVLILIAVAIHGLDPGFFRHAAGVIRGLPALSEEISTGEIATKIGDKYGWTDAQELRLKSFLIQHHERIRGVLENGQRNCTQCYWKPGLNPHTDASVLHSDHSLGRDPRSAPNSDRRRDSLPLLVAI
jgi:predicted PurR-regulated permease PerM